MLWEKNGYSVIGAWRQ